MELSQLTTFLLVARGNGLRHASHRLQLSLPAVSLRIKQLERDIGTRLFERKPNKLLLTEKGRLFLDQVERILKDLENSVASLHESESVCAGNISLALGGDMAVYLAPRIAGFVKNNPMVRVSVLSRSSPDTLELVLEGQVEIGIGRFKALPSTLKKTSLFTSGLVAISPKTHPLSKSLRLSLRDLASHSLIVLTHHSATRNAINHAFFKSGVELKTIMEAGGCLAIKQYVKLGLGVGLVHDICVLQDKDPHLKISDLRHLFGEWQVNLIHKKNQRLTLGHKKLIEVLSQTSDNSAPKLGSIKE